MTCLKRPLVFFHVFNTLMVFYRRSLKVLLVWFYIVATFSYVLKHPLHRHFHPSTYHIAPVYSQCRILFDKWRLLSSKFLSHSPQYTFQKTLRQIGRSCSRLGSISSLDKFQQLLFNIYVCFSKGFINAHVCQSLVSIWNPYEDIDRNGESLPSFPFTLRVPVWIQLSRICQNVLGRTCRI